MLENKNKNKIILDLCGGTGAWSEPYKKAGYDVRLITLPIFDVLTFKPPKNVYGILAAPPCTMFSRARSTGKSPRDFVDGMAIVQACLKIIWSCRTTGSLEFWALENPMGLLRQFLGNPAWSFRGPEFGDDHVKFTDIWGYYNVPKMSLFVPGRIFNKKGYSNPKKPPEYAKFKLDRAAIRAITPTGFARAFFEANP